MRRSLFTPLLIIVVLAVGALVATLAVGNSPELGLDLQGGASVVLRPPEGVEDDVLDQAIEVIRNRVDALGVAEPEIARQGSSVIVQLPGVSDPERAVEIVGQTAELRFRPVLELLPPGGVRLPPPPTTTTAPGATTTTAPGATTTTAPGATTTTAPGATTTVPAATTTSVPVEGASFQIAQTATTVTPPTTQASPTTAAPPTTVAPAPTTTALPTGDEGTVPLTKPEDNVADQEVVLAQISDDGVEEGRFRLGPSALAGKGVDSATARFNTTEWTTDLAFTGEGAPLFREVAERCQGADPTCPTGQVAIELDGDVISAPTIQPDLLQNYDGKATISGGFDEAEAKDLALVLRYGSLPVQLEPQTVQTVSASLGEDSLRAGLVAGAIGTALVLAYMILYYRALGLVVVLGLGIWGALQWSIISYLGASRGLALSLAGVTGIIVSVGVTVDSYVVYFERLKDEVRKGRSVRASVDRSFKRAFRTIAIADTSALLGAVVLYSLTVGPVRGFAFFLGLSTLLDLVVSYFFTRPLVALLGRRQMFTSANFWGVARGLGQTTPATPSPSATPVATGAGR